MKILYFHQHFSTPKGATGIRSYAMAKNMIDQGHKVTMVCGNSGRAQTGIDTPFSNGVRRGIVDGIEIIEFDLPYSNQLSLLKRAMVFFNFAFKSIKLVFTEKYDIVFATSTPLTAGIPGIFAKWFKRKKFVFEVRDLWPELPKAMGVVKNPIVLWMMSILEWMSYHSADRLVGLSPGMVDGIIKRGINPNKVTSIPNGCDLDIFSEKQHAWRPEKVKDTDLMAIFTGAHGLANGLDILVDVADELEKRGREDIKLVLVGDGMQKKALQQRVEQLNLSNIIFHDPVNKTKLAGLMASADIGLQILANVPAFYYGTSPNKFFDYISAGLPVLNNYPGWLAELIAEKQCGFTVSPENPQEFADALERAANNRENLKIMGQNSLDLAKTQFNRNILAADFTKWVCGVKND
ncbi:glycosyltransferase family 4 protein [Acinetobacter sp. YH12090]|uniref:glycosyltransferase family 4 protein n=1 Tax=Acinetobacter sp. YH12090 TaxID=2601081 RepID=UPI0015D17CEC|nr:glycosyltransferase family 4 protein [Acinetobacter sp. YH12090]